MNTRLRKNWTLFLIISLTLGLAPFNPPHLIGKIKWILGGNALSPKNGMKLEDWFDLGLHGVPWLLLLISSFLIILNFRKKE
jgi:hypothetical protein